jgi:hypothetical protein
LLQKDHSEKVGKNAAAYAAERLVLQETFLNSKAAAYKQEQLQIKSGTLTVVCLGVFCLILSRKLRK